MGALVVATEGFQWQYDEPRQGLFQAQGNVLQIKTRFRLFMKGVPIFPRVL
jgi:hypothetical protein